MSNLTSKQELINGLMWCQNEIKSLRRKNEIMRVELTAYDRLLGALEQHKPKMTGIGRSEDLLFQVEKTIDLLKDDLKK